MAWLESHQSLAKHRKTLRAAGRLQVDRATLIGHLHLLWWWGLDNAGIDGELGDVTAYEIALAAEWPGDPEAFVEALIDAGFIDRDDTGMRLHDWYDYAGKLNERRAKERERSRQRRAVDQRSTVQRPSERPPQDDGPTDGTKPNLTNHDDDDSAHAREEVAASTPPAAWPALFERVTGHLIGSLSYERFSQFADEMGDEVVCEALRRAEAAHSNNPAKYADGILTRWQQQQVRSLADVQRLDDAYERRRRQGAPARASPNPEEHLTVDELQRRRRERGEYVDGPAAEAVRELTRAIGRPPP